MHTRGRVFLSRTGAEADRAARVPGCPSIRVKELSRQQRRDRACQFDSCFGDLSSCFRASQSAHFLPTGFWHSRSPIITIPDTPILSSENKRPFGTPLGYKGRADKGLSVRAVVAVRSLIDFLLTESVSSVRSVANLLRIICVKGSGWNSTC